MTMTMPMTMTMTMPMPDIKIVGIDVSKGRLDVSVAGGPTRGFANTDRGIAELLEWLEPQGIGPVVYEPTGGYELSLGQALEQAGFPARRVHPNRVRAYAQACGLLAKTDRLDAQVLARYGAAFAGSERLQSERLQSEDEPARRELQDLLRRREQLVRQRVQEQNRLDKGLSPKRPLPPSATSNGSTMRSRSWTPSARPCCRPALRWPRWRNCTRASPASAP